jgi:glycosyltransferase involved in cell wall biosynthesis
LSIYEITIFGWPRILRFRSVIFLPQDVQAPVTIKASFPDDPGCARIWLEPCSVDYPAAIQKMFESTDLISGMKSTGQKRLRIDYCREKPAVVYRPIRDALNNSPMPSGHNCKELCIVDPNFTLESPTMKHLVYAIPALSRAGWTITALAKQIQADTNVEFFPLELRCQNPLLQIIELPLVAKQTVRRFKRLHPRALVFGTPGVPPGADVSAIHFLDRVWLQEARKLERKSLRERAALLISQFHDWEVKRDFNSGRTQLWLPVSDSIANEVRKIVAQPDRVRVLPNSYDETRFAPKTVQRWRRVRRAEFQYKATDFVFTFLSQGHHRRKGFWLAALALARLRREVKSLSFTPHFLVIGGGPATLERLQKALRKDIPDWSDWIRFVGMVERPEESLAAADAFLFPSYFEAFCLAEIEAAALELPLLLTPHFGSEMILQDGRNGLRISFDYQELAQQLENFLAGATPLGAIDPNSLRPTNFVPSVGKALTRDEYSQRLLQLLEEVWVAKQVRPVNKTPLPS